MTSIIKINRAHCPVSVHKHDLVHGVLIEFYMDNTFTGVYCISMSRPYDCEVSVVNNMSLPDSLTNTADDYTQRFLSYNILLAS